MTVNPTYKFCNVAQAQAAVFAFKNFDIYNRNLYRLSEKSWKSYACFSANYLSKKKKTRVHAKIADSWTICYCNVVVVRLHRSKDAVVFSELHRRLCSQVSVRVPVSYTHLTLPTILRV